MKTFRFYVLGGSPETQNEVRKALRLFGITGFQWELLTYRSTRDLIEEILNKPDQSPCMVIMSYARLKMDGFEQLGSLSKLNLKGVLVLNSEIKSPAWGDAEFQAQLATLEPPGYGITFLHASGGFTADRIKNALLSIMPWPI